MAEDQGVNGDIWNNQITKLLSQFNWTTLGDSNIDLPNDDGSKSGVDRLFTFEEPLRTTFTEGVILEAKRYKTDSFSASALQSWITTLDRKLNNLRNSSDLQEKFPVLAEIPLRTGIIVIWFHNVHDYYNYKANFKSYMANIKLGRKSQSSNKIYVMENDNILKLASLHLSIKELNSKIDNKFKFYYPPVDLYPAKRSTTLNINYMMSKFILGDFIDANGVENRVVFYFGGLRIEDFQRLRHALVAFIYTDQDKPLIIYIHERNDEFRKVEPEILKLFQENVELRQMELLVNLPTFMGQ